MQNPQAIAQIFKALAHKRRVRLFFILLQADKKRLTYGHLQTLSKMPTAPLTHHLRMLETCGLVTRTEKGSHTWFQLAPVNLITTLGHLQLACS